MSFSPALTETDKGKFATEKKANLIAMNPSFCECLFAIDFKPFLFLWFACIVLGLVILALVTNNPSIHLVELDYPNYVSVKSEMLAFLEQPNWTNHQFKKCNSFEKGI